MSDKFLIDIYRGVFVNHPFALMVIDKKSGTLIDFNKQAAEQFSIEFKKAKRFVLSEMLFNENGNRIKFASYEDLKNETNYKIRVEEGELLPVKITFEEVISDERELVLLNIQNLYSDYDRNNFVYQLASIVEFSDDAIISKSLDGKVISWNKAAEKVYGYSAEEMIGNSILKIYPQDKKEELNSFLEKIGRGERIENYETNRIRKDGTKLAISVTMSPVKSMTGKITGASSIERDITQRKNIEEEKFIKEKQLEEAQQIAHLGYWEYNLENGVIHWSDELYNIYGLNKDNFAPTSENFLSKIYSEDRENVKSIFAKALQDHRPFKLDYKIITPEGDVKIIHGRGEVLLNEAFKPVKLRGIGQDITEQKRAERRLEAQFEVTRILAESGRLIDITPRILSAICKGMEWQIGELWLVDAASNLLELEGSWSVPYLDASEFIEISKKCKFGKNVSLQGRVWEKCTPLWSSNIIDDQFFPRSSYAENLKLHTALAFPVFNKDSVIGVLEFYKVDISEPDTELLKMLDSLGRQIGDFIEKKKSEPALKESEELYQTLVGTSPDAITYTNLSGKILFCNQQAAELFGFRLAEDIVGLNFYAFIDHEDQPHALENEHNTIVNGKTKNIEYRLLKKDGTVFPAEVNTSIVFDAENQPKAFISLMRDISDRKNAENEIKARVEQQAIIAELGQFALKDTDFQKLMDKTSELVIKTLGIEFCDILEISGNRLFFIAGTGWNEGIVGKSYYNINEETHAYYTLSVKEPVILKNIFKENRFSQSKLLLEHKIISGITVIIQGGNDIFGILGAYTNRVREFNQDDVHFLQAIANVLESALARKKSENTLEQTLKNVEEAKEQLEINKKRLELLSEASRILNSSLDYYDSLKSIAKLIAIDFSDLCVIHLMDKNDNFSFADYSQLEKIKHELLTKLEIEKVFMPSPGSEIFDVFKTGKSVVYSDSKDNLINKILANEEYDYIIKSLGIKSCLIVPLVARDHSLGVLTFISFTPDYLFDEADLVFATDLASRISNAIDNSRLFRESKNLNEKLEFMVKERTSELEISNTELEVEIKMRQQIADELKTRVLHHTSIAQLGQNALIISDLKYFKDEVVEQVARTLNADYCAIFKFTGESKDLILKAEYGLSTDHIEKMLNKEGHDSLFSSVMVNEDTILGGDLTGENKHKIPEFLMNLGLTKGLTILIKDRNRPYGILGVYTKQNRVYSLNESYYLKSVANILTVFLERKHVEKISLALLDSTQDAILIVDEKGTIIQLNSQIEKLFKYGKNELLEHDVEILIPKNYKDLYRSQIERYLKHPTKWSMNSDLELYCLKKDDTVFRVEIDVKPFSTSEGNLITVTIRDISTNFL